MVRPLALPFLSTRLAHHCVHVQVIVATASEVLVESSGEILNTVDHDLQHTRGKPGHEPAIVRDEDHGSVVRSES